MTELPSNSPGSASSVAKRRTKVLPYSLRPAKNIERKMMGEAFARLARLSPLSKYRYIGFGSEFFNDFALYHETLGIRDMLSIEHDIQRVPRCEFNRPYNCIRVEPGAASEVLPKLGWEPRSIVWLDYLDRLTCSVLNDIAFVVSVASSGSVLVWTVNAHPWDDVDDDEGGKRVQRSDLPAHRVKKLRDSIHPKVVPSEWIKEPLAKWGLATVYHKLICAEVARALADRNASANADEALTFRQCFHFRYSDSTRMLTVGGLLLNANDAEVLGPDPFAELPFVQTGEGALEIKPPVLTGREVRYLSRLFPRDDAATEVPEWLNAEEIESFRRVYRYYPVYAESEL